MKKLQEDFKQREELESENQETIEYFEEEMENIKQIFYDIFGKETAENCYDQEGDIDFDKLKVATQMLATQNLQFSSVQKQIT